MMVWMERHISKPGTTSCIYAELLLVGCLSCTYLFEISHPAAVKSLGIHGSVGLDPTIWGVKMIKRSSI